MKKRRYHYDDVVDGVGFDVKSGEVIRLACCDCGLVHNIVFVSHDRKKIGVTMERNKRSTAQRRRWLTPTPSE